MRIVIIALIGALFAPSTSVWARGGKVDIGRVGAPMPPDIRSNNIRHLEFSGAGSLSTVALSLGRDSSSFNRPMTCSTLSTTGSAAPFEAIAVQNVGKGKAVLNLRVGLADDPHAACGDSVDTLVAVYDSLFAAGSPLTNCMMINDDANDAADRCSTLRNVEVPVGETRVIVVTMFGSRKSISSLDSQKLELSFSGSVPVTLQRFVID